MFVADVLEPRFGYTVENRGSFDGPRLNPLEQTKYIRIYIQVENTSK